MGREMKRVVGLVVLFCIPVTSALVAAEDAQAILERVKKKYDSIHDAQLTFLRRESIALTKTQQSVGGTLFIKKNNKYRVELSDRTIVTDGSTVWSYIPANKQVLVNTFKLDDNALTPDKVLAAAPKDYSASIVGEEKIGKTPTRVLRLVPNDQASLVETMKLWIDSGTWLIKKVEIVDVNGKQTVYQVNEMKTNIGIPDSRFTYEVPKGVETVDLR
jgi:outer membrane lipoprotein carrier protein